MTEPLVLIADHGAVRVLTLNRPAARNALSRDLIKASYTALTEADADESVRVVVLTGADPAFCAVWGTSRSSGRRVASPR
jgi:enoyl-CoA hydratase/carnithine racemase